MSKVTVELSIEVKAPLTEVFNAVLSKDAMAVFTNVFFSPNFILVEKADKYFRPGHYRTLYFDDTSSARVKLLTFLPEMSFSFKIYCFTSTRLSVLREVELRYNFIDKQCGLILIKVEQQFVWRSVIWAFLFKFFVQKFWHKHSIVFYTEQFKGEPQREISDARY